MHTVSRQIYCPYCGESIDIIIDTSVWDQQYIEDCSACCRPIEIEVVVDSDNVLIYPKRDDE